MNTPDTLSLSPTAFYQWDSIPYPIEEHTPDPGVATDSCYSLYMVQGEAVDTLVRPSMFTGHGLDQIHGGMTIRTFLGLESWIFVLLVVLTALLTLYYRQHKLHIADMLQSLFDSRAMDRMLRNNNLTRTIQLIPIGLLVVAGIALPVHLVAMRHTGIMGYLLLWAAVAAAYLLRNGIIRLLGAIFDDHAVDSYITSNYLYHLALATLVLPLAFLYCYMPYGHDAIGYGLLGVTLLEFLLRLFRGMKLFLTQSTASHFYLFYYLCSVELVPILVLIKWLIE